MHHFHIHNYVNHKEITFHIKIDNNLTIEEGHIIATQWEDMILKQYDIYATIHIEPINGEHSLD